MSEGPILHLKAGRKQNRQADARKQGYGTLLQEAEDGKLHPASLHVERQIQQKKIRTVDFIGPTSTNKSFCQIHTVVGFTYHPTFAISRQKLCLLKVPPKTKQQQRPGDPIRIISDRGSAGSLQNYSTTTVMKCKHSTSTNSDRCSSRETDKLNEFNESFDSSFTKLH
ncbi:hypothetical protein TNCV_2701201 [Trichonephila clavipes]|nr:hypothetical protein TNCV_2701201 [Trichonephila clavipes]